MLAQREQAFHKLVHYPDPNSALFALHLSRAASSLWPDVLHMRPMNGKNRTSLQTRQHNLDRVVPLYQNIQAPVQPIYLSDAEIRDLSNTTRTHRDSMSLVLQAAFLNFRSLKFLTSIQSLQQSHLEFRKHLSSRDRNVLTINESRWKHRLIAQ